MGSECLHWRPLLTAARIIVTRWSTDCTPRHLSAVLKVVTTVAASEYPVGAADAPSAVVAGRNARRLALLSAWPRVATLTNDLGPLLFPMVCLCACVPVYMCGVVGNVTLRTGLPPVEEVENEPAVVAILQECAEDDESRDEAVVAAARFLTCVCDACCERLYPPPPSPFTQLGVGWVHRALCVRGDARARGVSATSPWVATLCERCAAATGTPELDGAAAADALTAALGSA